MVIFRSFNDIVISFIEYLRLVQPELDTKPGTVSRDVFIDAPSQELADLYSELRSISGLQSLLSTTGTDLNKLAANFGATRATGSAATGVAVLTTNNLDVDILIPVGSIFTASNGINFQTTNNTVMSSANANVFRATATRLRTDLNLAGITDEFAVEVTVEALTTGTSGNIGKFSLVSQSIPGIANVSNLQSFSGGTNTESDSEFRTRVLSVFAGSNTGTALGYTTAIETVAGVSDSIVIVPGDPLLIRDGTQVVEDQEGNLIVSEPGSGGKVDIYILGTVLENQVDTFIYNDQSGKDDPTDPANDIVLGQRGQDTSLNIAQRRVELIAADLLPFQPVDSIISVSGSSSGSNFVEKFTDEDGAVRGNFELIKDTGDFGGSPFGFDKLRWISDTIELDDEEISKGIFNGTDALLFTDVTRIRDITRNVLVTNENSITNNTDRSIIQLRHTPVVNVSRIINLTTGERYIVENQNPDGVVGDLNTTGRVQISGNTLPVGTDVLQVDYLWQKPFDNIHDYDNLAVLNTFRTVQDSIDWGFGNMVTREPATVSDDGYGVLTVTVTHPINRVLEAATFETDISSVASGSINANLTVTNVIDIRRVSDNAELFNTDLSNGTLSGTTTIILPTDTLAEDGDIATIRFNATDIFSPDGYESSTTDSNVITLSEGFSIPDGTEVLVTYVAQVSTLIPESNLTSLPATKSDNKFVVDAELVGEQPTSNLTDSDGNITHNLRQAASHIRVNVDSIEANGAITISGTTRHRVEDALVTVTAGSGFIVNLQPAILSDLGASTLPSTVRVTKLVKLERVNLDNSNQVESVDNEYDIINYKLQNNNQDLENALEDGSLNRTTVELPQTDDNVAAQLNTGDVVRVTFYYTNSASSESLFFSRNGQQTTDKIFQTIDRIAIGSGFQNAAGDIVGTVFVQNFNQPVANTAYNADYNYIGPKENERITVNFNHNSLVNSATFAIEDTRPITADVLVKAAEAVVIDIEVRIVLLEEFLDQEQTVLQDAIDAIDAFLNTNSLGTTVDQSDVVNALYSVSGIDRVRIINFSTGDSGNLLSISADRNQYLTSGDTIVTIEER